jgi:hypothetical protein
MNTAGEDITDQLRREEKRHAEVVRRYREEVKQGDALVDQIHREAIKRHHQDEERGDALVEQIHREAVEHARGQRPLLPPGRESVHYLDQPAPKAGDLLFAEWITYRREAGRLLAEGNEGRHVLVKGDAIVGILPTHEDAMAEGYDRFGNKPFLVHELRRHEPVLRCVSMRTCRS